MRQHLYTAPRFTPQSELPLTFDRPEALLFQLEARDPLVTFAGAAALLVVVAVLAAWMPARRAARLNPVRVLREG